MKWNNEQLVVRYSISYGSILQVTIGHTLSHGVFIEIFLGREGRVPQSRGTFG